MTTSATASAAQAFAQSSQSGLAAAVLSSEPPLFQRDTVAVQALSDRTVEKLHAVQAAACPTADTTMPGRALHPADLSGSMPFQRDVAALHALGPRPLCEFLAELVPLLEQPARQTFFARLSAYRGLPAEAVFALGGDRFPARPPLPVPRD